MLRIDRNAYNNTEVRGNNSGFPQMEPGWYPCVILKAEATQTPWGVDSVTFSFDIIDGAFVRFYEKDYKAQTTEPKRWRGTLEQAIDDKGLPYFKGLITAIEESNPGFKFDLDETKLKGLKVGIGFRKEWYEKNGEDKYVVKAFAFRDIQKVISGELETPKDKPKRGTTGGVQGYTSPVPVPPAVNAYNATAAMAPKFEALTDDEELPF